MINRKEICVIPDHVVDGHKHLPCYGDNGLFVAPTFFQRFVFQMEVWIFLRALCGGKRTLHKQRLEVMPSISHLGGFLLSRACIVCG